MKLERIRELETIFEILKPDLTRNNKWIHQELENTSTISTNFEPKNKQPRTFSSDFSQFCQLKLFETNSTFTNQLKPDYFWSNFIHLSNETGNPELLTSLTCIKPFSITRRLVLNPNIIFSTSFDTFQRNKNFKHIQPFRHFSNWFELNLNLNLFDFFLRTAQPHVLFQSYFVIFKSIFHIFESHPLGIRTELIKNSKNNQVQTKFTSFQDCRPFPKGSNHFQSQTKSPTLATNQIVDMIIQFIFLLAFTISSDFLRPLFKLFVVWLIITHDWFHASQNVYFCLFFFIVRLAISKLASASVCACRAHVYCVMCIGNPKIDLCEHVYYLCTQLFEYVRKSCVVLEDMR